MMTNDEYAQECYCDLFDGLQEQLFEFKRIADKEDIRYLREILDNEE